MTKSAVVYLADETFGQEEVFFNRLSVGGYHRERMQVSGENVDDYKQNVRDGLRRMLDPPVDPLGGPVEWIIVYVRPSTIDPQSKGPGKVDPLVRLCVQTPPGP